MTTNDTATNQILIDIIAQENATAVINKVAKKVQSITGVLNKSMAKRGGFEINKELKAMPQTIGTSTEKLSVFEKSIKKTTAALEKTYQSARKFDMRMLSIMFAGMALQRAFGGALRSIKESFDKAENNTSQLSESTMGLSAAWEFLKFSIFNALDQPGFLNLIDNLIAVVDWVSDLVNKFPILGTTILELFAIFAVGGAIMMVLGQFALGWKALFGIGGLFASQAGVGIGSVQSKFATALTAMKVLAGLGIALYLFNDYMGRGEDYKLTAVDLVKDLGLASIGGYMVGGPYGALAGFLIMLVFDVKKPVRDELENVLAENEEIIASGESLGFWRTGWSELVEGLDMVLNPVDALKLVWDDFIESWRTGKRVQTDWGDYVKSQMSPTLNDTVSPALANVGAEMENLSLQTLDETANSELLTEQLPLESTAHYDNADAVNYEAEAFRNLADAKRDLADAEADWGQYGSSSDNIG